MTRAATAALVSAATLLLAAPVSPGDGPEWPLLTRSPTRAPLTLPAGFRAEIFAAGLDTPRALAVDPAGVLLVSLPSTGRVVALVPTSGVPRVVTVAAGLQLPHGLAFGGGDLYVAETGRVLRFRYDVTTRAAHAPIPVVADLPAGAHHWTRSIAFGPDGRLYVAIGSSCDVCREADPRRAAIVSYAADGTGARTVATGLRNPVGLAFHPASGVLWTTVNERDWRSGGAPPDFVTTVPAGAAFGWPDCYALDGTFLSDPELPEPKPCLGLTRPTLELPPHSAPLGMTFHRGRLLVALHGSRAELPEAGYKIVRVVLDERGRARAEDFATGWRSGHRVWGRPVDLVGGADGALYVSDDHGGRIVRIAGPR
jgi:glucose/arabinose dehydrogenase